MKLLRSITGDWFLIVMSSVIFSLSLCASIFIFVILATATGFLTAAVTTAVIVTLFILPATFVAIRSTVNTSRQLA